MKVPPTSNDAFNVVAVGAWNPAIFSPEWAKEHLADDKARDVIMAIPMPLGNLPPRLTIDGVNLYPSPGVLAADCVEYSDASIDGCGEKIKKISDLLPHTPIKAVGINFRFWGDVGDSDILSELFAFSDAGRIPATYVANGALIKRAFRLPEESILNVTIDTFSERLQVEFNFHSDVKTMAAVAAMTTAHKIRSARDHAIRFMRDVYAVEIEQ